jgi:3-phosphoshikimate 1-carboxyvinyltransferase
MKFYFSGEIPASKSILNRLLTIKSYSPSLAIQGTSNCEDVLSMKSALPKILAAEAEPADCGAAGTTLRFLALRASRIPGRHVLTGTPKLLSRPQQELCRLIGLLGSNCTSIREGLVIEGMGWSAPTHPLIIDRSQSSQFASAVLLNAWDLPFDLHLQLQGLESGAISQGYLDMTTSLVQQIGMNLKENNNSLIVCSGSIVKSKKVTTEPDLSSAFALAAMGAIDGHVQLLNFPKQSLQPDAIFPELLKKMGATIEQTENTLSIKAAPSLNAISVDLKNSPDLFPVLSVLCAYAQGPSRLFGAPHLAHKESSRIQSTAALLKNLGCQFEIKSDGIEIYGGHRFNSSAFNFDPMDDHRLAMAAAVANSAGANIQIESPHVVNKSFPEFWEILRLGRIPVNS